MKYTFYIRYTFLQKRTEYLCNKRVLISFQQFKMNETVSGNMIGVFAECKDCVKVNDCESTAKWLAKNMSLSKLFK